MLPTLGIWLRLAVEQRLRDEVGRAASELLPEYAANAANYEVWLSADAYWAAADSGRRDELRRMLSPPDPGYPWSMVGWAILDERYLEAADRFSVMGDVPNEAFARLLAAEQLASIGRRVEAEEQLQKAIAYFGSLGAARYIRRGEALLAASA